MSNAFYRNTSSSAKKKSERDRRQAASTAPDEGMEQSADVAVSEDAPRKRGRAEQAESQDARPERSLFTWSVDVTPSALVTMSVLGMILLAFSFLSGVIVGRGTMPLPQALELEKLAPEDSTAHTAAADRILSEEELRFMTSLKAREAEGVLSAAREAKKDAAKAEQAAKAERARALREARAEQARAEAARKAAEKAKAEQKAEKGARFDYVLRLAAFKEPAPAQRLAERLIKDGLKPQRHMGRSNTGLWHYVSLSMRGTADDLQAMRKRLAKFNVGEVMVISKKAVNEKKESRGAKKR